MVFLFLFIANISYSQLEIEWSGFDNFSIRNSFQTTKNASLPAELNISLPKDDEQSYLVNLGISYGIMMKNLDTSSSFPGRHNLSTTFEWHRNSLSRNEQNYLSCGLLSEWTVLNTINQKVKISPHVITKFAFNNNALNNAKSLSFYQYYTLFGYNPDTVKKGALYYILPQDMFIGDSNFFYYNYYLFCGFEYNNFINVEDGFNKGSYGTLLGMFTFILRPFPSLLNRKLELQVDYAYRQNIFDNVEIIKINRIFVFNANYIFVEKPVNIQFGVSYTKGDDPTITLYNQDIWKLALKVKL